MTQHVLCTAIPARSGSVMDAATHLAGALVFSLHIKVLEFADNQKASHGFIVKFLLT